MRIFALRTLTAGFSIASRRRVGEIRAVVEGPHSMAAGQIEGILDASLRGYRTDPDAIERAFGLSLLPFVAAYSGLAKDAEQKINIDIRAMGIRNSYIDAVALHVLVPSAGERAGKPEIPEPSDQVGSTDRGDSCQPPVT